MLLESNAPRIYPLGPRGEGRVRLVVEGAPAASWLLTAGPERLEVERGGGEADATITAPAEVLALLVYGRVDLADQERRGRAQIAGDRSLVERIRTIFPGP
jgi:SCP-2 sterol transfer family